LRRCCFRRREIRRKDEIAAVAILKRVQDRRSLAKTDNYKSTLTYFDPGNIEPEFSSLSCYLG
jgi:hypothetical protein